MTDSSEDSYLFFSHIFIYTVIHVSNWILTKEDSDYDDETWRILDVRLINGLCSPNTIRSEAYLFPTENPKLRVKTDKFRFIICNLKFLENVENFRLFRIFSTVSPTFISFGQSFSDSDIINNLFLVESYLSSKEIIHFVDKFSVQNHWCHIECQGVNLKEYPSSSNEDLSATNYLKETVIEFVKQESDAHNENTYLPDVVMIEIGNEDFLYKLDIKYIEDSIYKLFGKRKSFIRIISSNFFCKGVLISSLSANTIKKNSY